MPLTATFLPAPTWRVSNAPVDVVPRVSPEATPVSATLLTVAVVVRSYTLFATLAVPTVSDFAVIVLIAPVTLALAGW
jgi:hypothetical protein